MGEEQFIQVTCNIGNPLSGGASLRVSITLNPVTSLVGDEDPFNINLRVQSINPGTTDNLMASGTITITAEADVTIEEMGYVGLRVKQSQTSV